MQETLTVIMTWLTLNMGLAATDVPAGIEIVPKAQVSRIAAAGASVVTDEDVEAVYDDRTRTIYLAEGWTGATPRETSILVHEAVHHLQNMSLKFG